MQIHRENLAGDLELLAVGGRVDHHDDIGLADWIGVGKDDEANRGGNCDDREDRDGYQRQPARSHGSTIGARRAYVGTFHYGMAVS